MVAEHYEINIDMIFHFIEAQDLVAEQYVKDFDIIFQFKTAQKLGCTALGERF